MTNKSFKLHSIAGRRGWRRNHRGGTAVAECALCLPLVLLFTFATLEICSAIFLKESLAVAAYEGARIGIQPNKTNTDARDSSQSVLRARGVTGATVSVTPDNIDQLDALQAVTVRVQAPMRGNSSFIGQFFRNSSVSAEVTMLREFDY